MYLPISDDAKSALASGTAAGAAILTAASADAQLSALGGGSEGILIFKDTSAADILTELDVSAFAQSTLNDADAATFRATIGASGLTVAAVQSADFTAAVGNYYPISSTGAARAVTLPACVANGLIGFKLVAAGNTVTLTRDGSDTIDGANTKTMTVLNENFFLRGNEAGTAWMVE